MTVASNFLELELSSPKDALYIIEDRPSDVHRSKEKLWQAAAISSNVKLRRAPEGGKGKGPEGYNGPLPAADLKLPAVFRTAAP